MPGIFISYRRDDQAGFAGRLADALGLAFDADNVFRDIEDIHPGEDFVDAINQQLTSVDVFLVIIGPAWLTVSRHGVRRLDEPEDFVRMEIEAGLKSGKMLLPVLVGGSTAVTLRDRDGCTDGEDEVMETVLERRGGGGMPDERDGLISQPFLWRSVRS